MKSTLDFASTYLSTLGNYKQTTKPIEQGTITAFGDGIARVAGLPNAQLGEIIRFSDGSEGLALNLNQDDIGCIILGEARELTVGDAAYTTGQLLSIPASDELAWQSHHAIGSARRRQTDSKTHQIYAYRKSSSRSCCP
jgi:F-type H+/Na+-transporting ATPase subunit alpha